MTSPPANASPDQQAEHRFFALSIDMLCFARFDGSFQPLDPS